MPCHRGGLNEFCRDVRCNKVSILRTGFIRFVGTGSNVPGNVADGVWQPRIVGGVVLHYILLRRIFAVLPSLVAVLAFLPPASINPILQQVAAGNAGRGFLMRRPVVWFV